MKPINLLQHPGARGCCAALLGLTLPAIVVLAADTNTPPATAAATATNAPAPSAAAPASQTNAPAPEAAAPAPLTPEQMFEGGAKTYNNWIDTSAGGFISSGNKSQFQQRDQTTGGAVGGIE